jgi:hypothetical protein
MLNVKRLPIIVPSMAMSTLSIITLIHPVVLGIAQDLLHKKCFSISLGNGLTQKIYQRFQIRFRFPFFFLYLARHFNLPPI